MRNRVLIHAVLWEPSQGLSVFYDLIVGRCKDFKICGSFVHSFYNLMWKVRLEVKIHRKSNIVALRGRGGGGEEGLL